jgi:catechol 2,3-dioxygenase-like lactoylglutathione lyase family enzyme
MHHLCFEVPDVDAAIEELAAQGVELIDRQAEPGAQGRVAFLHPRANHGVLIELMSQA